MTSSKSHRHGGGRDGGHHRRERPRCRWPRLRLPGPLLAAAVVTSLAATGVATSPAAAAVPRFTTSHYELNGDPAAFARQGVAAGRSDAQGIVILDFGRPAARGHSEGTIDYEGRFLSLAEVSQAVESYVRGYLASAPADTTLDVAVGTNNSCGAGQPCGSHLCGCRYEPPSYRQWGRALAARVERLAAWATALRRERGYSDVVRVVAADDIEPAYDPGYVNTYEVLKGYEEAVAGSDPPMVDYGSADPSFWPESRLYQVAYGFRPDVPMPEVYDARQAAQWGALLRYARVRFGQRLTIFGVLTTGGGSNPPGRGYAEMERVAGGLNRQGAIPWLSRIAPLVSRPARQAG